jgi:seryl-tRNA synthetase
MLDLNFVRDNLARVEEKPRQRGMNPAEALKDFGAIDTERRHAITQNETLQARRNRASEEIAKLKKSGQDASALIQETKDLREQIQVSEKEAAESEERLREILAALPNLPHASVPVGKSAEDNVEARRWGAPLQFDFKPKPHWELGESLGVLDLERAVKLTGARFAVYWDLGARLERALANFMLDLHTREHGYTEVLPPYLVNSESMYGTGQLPKFASACSVFPPGGKTSGSFLRRKSRSRISIAKRFPMARGSRFRSPPIRHASAARRDRTVRCPRYHPAASNSKRWSW